MHSIYKEIDSISYDEENAVSDSLRSQGYPWTGTPLSNDYTDFCLDKMTSKLDQVYAAIRSETDADIGELDAAYEKSRHFIDSSFDFYHGKKNLDRNIARAFVVPMRASRRDESYAGEWDSFYPLLNSPKFGVSAEIGMRAIYGLPPTVLDTYTKGQGPREAGVLVLAPIYADMLHDLAPDSNDMIQQERLARVGAEVLEATARFAHLTLGAKVIGLGATLPNMTRFGQSLRRGDGMGEVVTTTGHGGTVHMIAQTVRKIREESSTDTNGTIGVIGGAGSIGWASIRTLALEVPDHTISAYDKREAKLHKLAASSGVSESITIESSIRRVLETNHVIVVAITEQVDLCGEEYSNLDLSGKIIVDDSQPGCFDRNQVEALGGKLVWVVGEDASDSQFVVRDGYYTGGEPSNYGDNSGLNGRASEFACGQEAAVISKTEKYSSAVTGPVSPADVQRVGRLFLDYGLRAAPFQSFGRPVEIN